MASSVFLMPIQSSPSWIATTLAPSNPATRLYPQTFRRSLSRAMVACGLSTTGQVITTRHLEVLPVGTQAMPVAPE